MSEQRVGIGYDIHRLEAAENGQVVLGGIHIPCPYKLIAHSDGDVVIHALCDALLGAIGAGDIGRHFPDTDPANEGIDSRELLRRTMVLVKDAGCRLGNADLTIVAQAPKMAPHVDQMRENLAADMGAPSERVNVKATTTERLGYIGRNEGIAVHAVVLLELT